MPSFLFWNIAGKGTALKHVVRLVSSIKCDSILLAESPGNVDDLVTQLNVSEKEVFRDATLGSAKVKVITKLARETFYPCFVTQKGDLSLWNLITTNQSLGVVQFAFVHLLSKLTASDESQTANAIRVARAISDFEDFNKCYNTALIGDINMNPFDGGMVVASGFHAAMTVKLAKKERSRDGKSYRKFYNPMWGCFGDRTPGPPGSCYWSSTEDHNHHWQILDHVLVRPSLVEHLTDLEILDHDGRSSLTNKNGVPTKRHISDHLPILSRFNF